MKRLLLLVLLSLSFTGAFAHAYWIQAQPVGKKGQAHQVEIFFAEPADKRESLDSKEMANVKNFTVWLLAPGKEKVKLQIAAASDHYTANFTPDTDGEYLIVLQNDQVDVLDFPSMGPFKAEFYASAKVQVGGFKAQQIITATDFKFNVLAKSTAAHQPVYLSLTGNVDLSKVEISIFNQAGWKLDLKPGADGQAEFKALEKGKYFIEAVYKDKTTGTFNNKDYKSVYYASTTIAEIGK